MSTNCMNTRRCITTRGAHAQHFRMNSGHSLIALFCESRATSNFQRCHASAAGLKALAKHALRASVRGQSFVEAFIWRPSSHGYFYSSSANNVCFVLLTWSSIFVGHLVALGVRFEQYGSCRTSQDVFPIDALFVTQKVVSVNKHIASHYFCQHKSDTLIEHIAIKSNLFTGI